MNRFLLWIVLVVFSVSPSSAHEMTPTYPELKSSYIDGVVTTKMRLFNRRVDVEYYEISVYDGDWELIPFATENRLLKIDYLQTTYFDIYIRSQDIGKVKYICTLSKLKKDSNVTTAISSRICSKIK